MPRNKPIPRSQRLIFNRGEKISRSSPGAKDDVKNISVGIMDMDSAIMYYFNEVIKPVVVDNNEKVKVPVYYANPERWKSIQKLGYLRDVKGQLVTPLIIFKRTSLTKDTNNTFLARSISPASSNYTFLKKYTKENRFTQTSTLFENDEPLQEAHNVVMPSYVTVNYNCIAFTPYIDQMNQIIEKISWSRKSYWGEPDKFKFKAGIRSCDKFGEDSLEISSL